MIDFEMEIFGIGTHMDSQGRTQEWTEKDLDEIAQTYEPGLHEAPIVIGHPKGNAPAYGWIKGLKRVGDRLVAMTRAVPEFVEMVKKGLFKKRSASIYLDFQGTGKRYLEHVGFLGAVAPAVKGLADIKFEGGGETQVFEFQEEEGKSMSWKERVKQMFSKAVDEIPDDPGSGTPVINLNPPGPGGLTQGFSEEEVKKREEAAAAKARDEAKTEYHKNLKEKEGKIIELQQATTKKEITSFCEGLKEKGHLLPAWEKLGLVSFMESLEAKETVQFAEDGEKVSQLEFMKKFLAELPKTVTFGEVGGKKKTGDAGSDDEKREQLISEHMEKSKVEYKEALLAVSKKHPELFQQQAQ